MTAFVNGERQNSTPQRLTDSVVVLRPTQHKTGHFGDVSPSQSLGLVWKKTKPNTTKARIHQSKEM